MSTGSPERFRPAGPATSGQRKPCAKGGVADAVVDASVWVSRFVTHDAHHAASVRWLAETTSVDGLLAAPALLLPEVAGPIARITKNPRLARRVVSRVLRVGGSASCPSTATSPRGPHDSLRICVSGVLMPSTSRSRDDSAFH